ncbi:hypothetical protein DMC16_15505 [Lacticaseibacillus paracasei]|uniref:hypothetical protein n=1 Tax=Lacticaseibacillus paracasei TaxID=1597 RepID=UPI000D76CD9D|nr:hypothetical protein [Lacticaseibacillus paracasei]AWR92421.1 hypothetical protein DMC16_15505 [Lacticaseibacillus paracasei]
MEFLNKELLLDWQNNVDKVAELTKHNTLRTSKKTRLTDLLYTVSAGKIVGATEHKQAGRKLLSIHKLTTNTVPALADCLGDLNQLPAFLKQFYSEILQREDYKQACSIASANIEALPKRASGTPSTIRDVFIPINKFDPYRDSKKLIADVWQAVNLLAANQVAGHQLANQPGRGIYITKDLIMSLLVHPEKATQAKVANALMLLRIACALHLGQPDELTSEGKKLTKVNNRGKLVNSHHVYILGDFNTADWDLVSDNFNLNLSTPPSKMMLIELFGEQVGRDYFPDLSGGIGQQEINFFMKLKDQKGYVNEPIMTAKAAADTVSSISGVKDRTSRQYVDQICNVKPVELEKMSKSEARRLGYLLLGDYKATKPAEKLIVPVTNEALRMCLEHLAEKNDKLKIKARMRKNRR